MEQQALLLAIRANPEDRTARLVYADWLDEHDDPLAGYVRGETDLAALEPGGREWCVAVQQLRDRCGTAHEVFGGWEYVSDLARLRDKIDRLRTLDPRMEVFGAGDDGFGHRYVLEPVLREPDLLAFESRHGCFLPAEYRAFLLRVGNGRVGPDYGLRPLDLAHDYQGLREPFPITPEFAATIAEAERRSRGSRNWGDIPQPDETAWDKGYLELCDHGCGNYSVLIVNGQLKGEVWWQGDLGLVPSRDKSDRPVGFLSWYVEWLDRWLAPGAIGE